MPIYEYQCTACGHEFDELQSVSEPALTECPQCHKATLTKLVSATQFQLVGDGWYETDFKNKGKKPQKAAANTESSTNDDANKTATTATTSSETTQSKGKTEHAKSASNDKASSTASSSND
ncbi:MAG: hypothetical protein Tsb005_01480 [Gammaproteobacteria bacterium]